MTWVFLFGLNGWVHPLMTLVAVISWTDLQMHRKIPKTHCVHKSSFLFIFQFPLGEDEDYNSRVLMIFFFFCNSRSSYSLSLLSI